MGKAIRGALITCDQAVKTIILDLNSTENFILEDLDETHLFIEHDKVDWLKEHLETVLEDNAYRVGIEWSAADLEGEKK